VAVENVCSDSPFSLVLDSSWKLYAAGYLVILKRLNSISIRLFPMDAVQNVSDLPL
jgi:hypothetical protein